MAAPKAVSDESIAPTKVRDPSGLVRLPGEVPAAIASLTKLPRAMAANARLILTIVLNRSDQQSFEAFLDRVQNPRSPSFRHYLSQHELADRFGPSQQAYDAVLHWLRRQGFTLVEGSANRLTLTIRGTRVQAEQAFGIHMDEYRLGNGTFYANDRDPVLPANIGSYVQAVIGLSNLAQPVRAHSLEVIEQFQEVREGNLAFSCWLATALDTADTDLLVKDILADEFGPSAISPAVTLLRYQCIADELNLLNRLAAGLPAGPPQAVALTSVKNPEAFAERSDTLGASGPLSGRPGAGQKIGLLEFDNFHPSDVRDFLNLVGRGSQFSQLSQVDVAGGAGPPRASESEVLLDIDAVMSLAPGAQVIVYDGPFNGRGSYQTMFNAMINDGVSVISNSWAYCEGQTTAADLQSIDSILASAAASGITVLNGSGDKGSTCLDGSLNTVHVPASSPHGTAVGGVSPTLNIGGTYLSESWWNGSGDMVPTGQGGFGLSRFFARPTYQDRISSAPQRSVPDVTALADPRMGVFICQADAGGCPTGLLYGGTSLAAPIWAAFVAVLNQQENRKLGFLNPLLYPLANTTAFHSAAELGSDFAHVGLGSPNVGALHLALIGATAGPFDTNKSVLGAFPPVVFADGTSEAGVTVVLVDAAFNSLSGQSVQLMMNNGAHAVITTLNSVTNASNGAALFTVTDTVPEMVTFTATVGGVTLSQHPTLQFVSPPATAGGISAIPTTVTANNLDTTTITVTLQDAKGNSSPGKVVGLSQGDGSSTVSGATATTDATGRVQFTATDYVAETVTYTATDITDGNLPIRGSATVNFVNPGFQLCGALKLGTAASGYAVTTFASGFKYNASCSGPIGVAFDAQGKLLVGNVANGTLYRFGPEGGAADPGHQVNTARLPDGLAGLAFAKDGRLYAALASGSGGVVELDPASGAILRVVVNSPSQGLAVDPQSGDLFVSNFDGVQRISNFANGPGTIAPYYSSGAQFTDGIAFSPDGTLYVKAGCCPGFVAKVNGTNTAKPGVGTVLVNVKDGDGIALEANPSNPSKPFLYVNRNNGIITKVDTSALPATPTDPCGSPCTDIYTGGSRGDFVTVGPEGCLYATQTDRVVRVTNADGSCSLTPVYLAPQIVLTPQTTSSAQGTSVSFTAALKNVTNLANVPVTLVVAGANPGPHLAKTDANGNASFNYIGVLTGTDRLIAFANIGNSLISSNPAAVNWTEGKHSTFLSLNMSPASGVPNRSLTVTAQLVDISATPPVALSAATVSFGLAGQTCTGITDGAGTASCSITPSVAAASYPLTANFGGTSQLLSSSASKTVDLVEAPAVSTPTIQFSNPAYSVNEGCVTATIIVTRSGDTSPTVTVDYATADGTASQRTKYTIGSGTVTIASGATSQTFPVLISKDAYIEGPETVNLSLSNPTGGAFLGAISTATLTIIDDSSVPTNSQPLDDAMTFVCQHYHDFLSRTPDSGGLAYWTGQITQCGTDQTCIRAKRIDVSNAFFFELEFQQTGAYVYRLYRSAYGNNQPFPNPDNSNQVEANKLPNYGVFARDRARVVGGADLATGQQMLANAFVQRPEFLAKYPANLDGSSFIDAVLATIKNDNGVDLTSQKSALMTLFNAGGRGAVLFRLADDNAQTNPINNRAFIDAEYNRAFVFTQYAGYLRRDADMPGFLFWLGQVNGCPIRNVGVQHAMVCSFITPAEYQNRFSSVVTHTNAECPQTAVCSP